MADDMEVDPPATGPGKHLKDDVKDKKRFEVKKVL
jgi:RING-box protein 1